MPSPSPSPLWLRVEVGSAWLNRSKTRGRNSGEIPWPLSLTVSTAWDWMRWRRIWIRPPRGVNFAAFDSRFQTTCCSRSGSPDTMPALGSRTLSMAMPLAPAAGRTTSMAARITSVSSIGRTSRRSFPALMREKSRMSSIRRPCARAFRPMVSSPCINSSGSDSSWSSWIQPIMLVRGVRNSWETVARKSSRARVAVSAAVSARRSSARVESRLEASSVACTADCRASLVSASAWWASPSIRNSAPSRGSSCVT